MGRASASVLLVTSFARLRVFACSLALMATAAVAPGAMAGTPSAQALAESPSLWITPEQIDALPQMGSGWAEVERWAAKPTSVVLGDRNEDGDVSLLAATYKAIAENNPVRLNELRAAIIAIPGTELIVPARSGNLQGDVQGNSESGDDDADGDGESLALARNLPGVLIAAQLLDLNEADTGFRLWLRGLLTRPIGSQQRSLVSTHEQRANNWGTHAGAARVAAALYLNDPTELDNAAAVFRGWLGEREFYNGFVFGSDLSWHANPLRPVGVNPAGATINGHSVDGVLPDDQRQAGAFAWPPVPTDRAWEAMQGAVLTAQLLADNGYPAWDWGDKALLRAAHWLFEQAAQPPTGDDLWILPILDQAYGTRFSLQHDPVNGRPGKSMGFTALTHPKYVVVNSAVLPSSRAARLGGKVTTLAALVTDDTATACTIDPALSSNADIALEYQRFDLASGTLTGSVNEPMNLERNTPVYLFISIRPQALMQPAELDFGFRCHEGNAGTIEGLNTLLLSASDLPVPDMVALVATKNNNGIVDLPAASADFGFFSVAAINLGTTAELTASPTAVGTDLEELLICATDADTGACLGEPATEVTLSVAAGETPTFAVFARTSQEVLFDPARTRLVINFTDDLQLVRGRTSVAVRSR